MPISVQDEAIVTSNLEEEEISIGVGKKRGKQPKTPPASASNKKSSGKRRLTPTDPEWPMDVPDTFKSCEKDWRSILRHVMQQGGDEICWAIALTRNIEASLAVRGIFVNLSIQHLINNIKCMNVRGSVRKYDEITLFLIRNGLVAEEECQFTGKLGQSCSHMTPETKIKELKAIEKPLFKEEEVIKLVESSGPVAVVIDSYLSFLNFKGDGIYYGHAPKEKSLGRHMVLVIGYGTSEEGIHYWLIQNSWGVGWVEDGFGKVVRQCSLVDNKTSLFLQLLYPVV